MRRTDTVARCRRISRCAAASSTCSRPARSRRCGSISSATRSRASAASIPATQRTIGRIDGFTLLPASETLLDEDSVKRFRSALSRAVRRHRDRRSALPGGVGRAAARRHRPLAALVRGAARHLVRPSRATTTSIVRDARRRRRRRRAVRGDRRLLREPQARPDRRIPAATGRSSPETLYLAARRMGAR